MKNKKGFTLVELLAVIVILALIMGIAVVGIGSVLSKARTDTMWESAQSMLEGIKQRFVLENVTADGTYGFNSAFYESGANRINDQEILYGTKGGSDTLPISGNANVWKHATAKSGCTTSTTTYVKISSGEYSICIVTAGGKTIINGTQAQINARTATLTQS